MYLNLKYASLLLIFVFTVLLTLIGITGNPMLRMEGRMAGNEPEILVPMSIAMGSFITLIVIFVFIAFSVRKVLRSRKRMEI